MTPYNVGTTASIDPTLKPTPEVLFFGTLGQSWWDLIGTIKKREYVHKKRCMGYLVEFEGHEEQEMWFLEDELITVYEK